MDKYIIQPSNYNYFPERDRIVEVPTKQPQQPQNYDRKTYEFLTYHPVCVTSEMVGTSIEELVMHNFPTKRSWESSRLSKYPQELIIRLNYRSHMKYILIKTKIHRFIDELELYIADGLDGNFNDANYRRVNRHRETITDQGTTIKIDGIGNYLKIVFTRASFRTQDNPFGQVSVAQLKVFGKKINHLLYYDPLEDDVNYSSEIKESVDSILISMGLPLNDPYFIVNDQNYEIAPVDNDTKVTLKDLLDILRRSDKSKLL